MPEITKAALSRLVGVSKPAISKAVSSHHLVVTGDGLIDTDVPSNAAWIAAKRAGLRQASKANGATVAPSKDPLDANFQAEALKRKAAREERQARAGEKGIGRDEAEGDIDDPDGDLEVLIGAEAEKTALTKARRELAQHDTQLRALAIAQKKGTLFPKEEERRRWAAFDAALKSNLRDIPRRATARLHAVAVAEGPQALERALEAELSSALVRVVEAAKAQGLT